MKTLFPALRVSDLDVSLVFYRSFGYEVVGQLEVDDETRLAMLALPGEREVSLELVHRASAGPVRADGLDHLAVQVGDLDATRAQLAAAGLDPGEVATPGGPQGPRTVEVIDPDGFRLELVQWPPGHPVDMTRDDFPDEPPTTAPRDDEGALR